MKVLVTGADGFVGGHLVEHLRAEGHDVSATMWRVPPDTPEALELDVLDPAGTKAVVASVTPDLMFHLAGYSSGGRARSEPARALRTNAEGTLNAIEAIVAAAPACRLVVPSSADVYGDPGPDLIVEETPVAPRSAYGVSKAAQELVAIALAGARGVDVRVARLFPLTGPGQTEEFVIPNFCRQAVEIAAGRSEPAMRVGNLDVQRDFMDVRDGVAALTTLAMLETPEQTTYNVCSGKGTSIREMLDWILEEAGIGPAITVDPERMRDGDPPRIVGSPNRLRHETGWEASRNVRDGVRDTYSWVRRSGNIH